MKLAIHATVEAANAAAADCLARWLEDATTGCVIVAGGNTPLDLYRRVAERQLSLERLKVFALDEYVGVPPDDPRTVSNLLRRCVADAWGIPPERFYALSSLEAEAPASVEEHERRLHELGGLDVAVLGLGENGHLGFNEPGGTRGSRGRVVKLEASSIEANRRWFGGDYAPAKGVTVGLRALLAARRVLVLAHGSPKAGAVQGMVEGPVGARCPASFLRSHPSVQVFLDEAAASGLARVAVRSE